MVDLASIGTAVSIAGKVGGLLGIGEDDGPSIGEQYAMSRQHMAKAPSAIRRGAERAGFNPLTVLGSGAVGGSPGISLPGSGGNSMASLEGIGTALNDHVERKQAATLNAANIELAAVQAERAKAGGVGDVFTRTRNSVLNYTPRKSGGVGPTSDPLTRWEEDADDMRKSNRDLKTPLGTWVVDEKMDPASMFEDEYGDVASAALGIGKLAHDAGKTTRSYLSKRFGGMFADPAPTRTFKPLHIEVN